MKFHSNIHDCHLTYLAFAKKNTLTLSKYWACDHEKDWSPTVCFMLLAFFCVRVYMFALKMQVFITTGLNELHSILQSWSHKF